MEDLDKGDYNDKFSDYYKLVNIIGKGSFGFVVHAIDKYSKDEIAVKVIKKSELKSNRLEGLRQEAIVLSQLHHPNVVKFKHVKESQSRIFIAMELIKGGTLENIIRKKKLTEHSAVKAMTGIFRAVEYLHNHGIVHRDLKPENILVEDTKNLMTVKVADFGLCAHIDLSAKVKEHCGTIIFMAPEQAQHKFYSREVDIWSCGIILYMMISKGKHPLASSRDTQLTYIARLENPKWTFPITFPPLAQNLFLKLMKLKPIERYTATQALAHPWIMRNTTVIPLTYLEKMSNYNADLKIRSLIYSLLFIATVDIYETRLNDEVASVTQELISSKLSPTRCIRIREERKCKTILQKRNVSPSRRTKISEEYMITPIPSPDIKLSSRNKSTTHCNQRPVFRPTTAKYRIRRLK
jgi:calcium/calmodulin-dependent protein kinase I